MKQAKVIATLEKKAEEVVRSSIALVLDERPVRDLENTERYVRHSVVFGAGEATSLGHGCFRYPGIQYLSIFYRPGKGHQSLYELSDTFVNAYTHLILAGDPKIVFYVASTIKLPPDAGGFAQLQVVCPFYFDTRS